MALTRLLISGSEVRVLHGPPTKRALPEHRKRPLIFGQRFEGQRREKCSEIGMSPTFDCRCRPARLSTRSDGSGQQTSTATMLCGRSRRIPLLGMS